MFVVLRVVRHTVVVRVQCGVLRARVDASASRCLFNRGAVSIVVVAARASLIRLQVAFAVGVASVQPPNQSIKPTCSARGLFPALASMPKASLVREFETPPPLTLRQSILAFLGLIPCGAASAFVVLASLSTLGILSPRRDMLQWLGSTLLFILVVYGPFWRVVRRDPPFIVGFAVGILATVSVWLRANGS